MNKSFYFCQNGNKISGSALKSGVGRVNGNTGIFCLGLKDVSNTM